MLSCSHAEPGSPARPKRGPVAQLGARLNGIEEAGGSNPPRSTTQTLTPALTLTLSQRAREPDGGPLPGGEGADRSTPSSTLTPASSAGRFQCPLPDPLPCRARGPDPSEAALTRRARASSLSQGARGPCRAPTRDAPTPGEVPAFAGTTDLRSVRFALTWCAFLHTFSMTPCAACMLFHIKGTAGCERAAAPVPVAGRSDSRS